jgi:hypothetical protein
MMQISGTASYSEIDIVQIRPFDQSYFVMREDIRARGSVRYFDFVPGTAEMETVNLLEATVLQVKQDIRRVIQEENIQEDETLYFPDEDVIPYIPPHKVVPVVVEIREVRKGQIRTAFDVEESFYFPED